MERVHPDTDTDNDEDGTDLPDPPANVPVAGPWWDRTLGSLWQGVTAPPAVFPDGGPEAEAAAAEADTTGPEPPPGIRRRIADAVADRAKRVTVGDVVRAAGGAMAGGLTAGPLGAAYGAMYGFTKDPTSFAATVLPGLVSGIAGQMDPSWVGEDAPRELYEAMNAPGGRIATYAGLNAARAFYDAAGGLRNRVRDAGLSLAASLSPFPAVYAASSPYVVETTRAALDGLGASPYVSPETLLRSVWYLGPGLARAAIPGDIHPQPGEGALSRIADSVYNGYLWSQYLGLPSAPPAVAPSATHLLPLAPAPPPAPEPYGALDLVPGRGYSVNPDFYNRGWS